MLSYMQTIAITSTDNTGRSKLASDRANSPTGLFGDICLYARKTIFTFSFPADLKFVPPVTLVQRYFPLN